MKNLWMRAAAVAALTLGATSAPNALAEEDRLQWQLYINEGRVSDANLIYAVPDTDYQLISLTCEQGGARIFAALEVTDARMRELRLKSGAQALVVGGKATHDEDVDITHFASQEMDANSPLFDAFAVSGSLTHSVQGHETVMKGDAKARALIARFIRFCRG